MKIKYIILIIFLVVTLSGCIKHIDDTNGNDDYTIETFSDLDITSGKNSYITVNSITKRINNKIELKVGKFTGIYQLSSTKVSNQTLIYNVTSTCTSGNFRIVIIKDFEIIEDVEINKESMITIENANGTYILKIIGESAKINLTYSIEKH